MNYFDQITNIENIKLAYFDLVQKFDTASKSGRYRGIDGVRMNSLDFVSEETLILIQQEMLELKKITPAYMATIPKKNGKKRKIYVYTIKERIKAEAIYRILLPFFDTYFSPFLFSYRSSHPSYYAAKSAVRRYRRFYGHNYVLVTDISDYADTIDHDILLEKLRTLPFDESTQLLLKLFIQTDTLEQGLLIKRPRGVLTGTPLYALLSNFYMDDFDKWAGKQVAFYRRVGDDIIAMDKDEQKIKQIHDKLQQTTSSLKLTLNKDKARLIKDTEPFNFLGYSFTGGTIGFDESSKQKALSSWKKQLPKPKHLRQQFEELVHQKNLVNDTAHMKRFSEQFFIILTSYFKGSYSPKKRRLLKPFLTQAHLPSLFDVYRKAKYPHTYVSKK